MSSKKCPNGRDIFREVYKNILNRAKDTKMTAFSYWCPSINSEEGDEKVDEKTVIVNVIKDMDEVVVGKEEKQDGIVKHQDVVSCLKRSNSTRSDITVPTATSIQYSSAINSMLKASNFSISFLAEEKITALSCRSYESDGSYDNKEDINRNIINEQELESSLANVLKLRSKKERGLFIEMLNNHLRKILVIIELGYSPGWCLDYLKPLLEPVDDNSANFIQSFDESCGLLNRIAGITTDLEVLEFLENIINCLIKISKRTDMYGQISYETVLCLMAESTDSFVCLQELILSRTSCKEFYEQSLIQFRCRRADCLKVLFGKAVRSEINYLKLIDECIKELKISYNNEPSNRVKSAYYQIFQEFNRRVPSITRDFDSKSNNNSKIYELKWNNAKRSISMVIGE